MKKQSQIKQKRSKGKNVSTAQDQSKENSGRQSIRTKKIESESSQSGIHTEVNSLPMTAEEFDRRFDEGESVFDLGFDPAKARRPGLEIRRITVDLPAPFLDRLDHWAAVRGMTRQALIKSWLYDRLEKQAGN
jgi:hypothetical protein